MITHPACGKSWTGLRRTHCPAEAWLLAPLTVGYGDASLLPEGNSHLHESPVDAGRVAAKLLADLTSTHATRVQTCRYRPPANLCVFESVILGGQGAKVFGSVIGPVPVDVVNLVFKDDLAVDHPVLVGLDVFVGADLPAEADVSVGGEVPTRLLLGDPFSRSEVVSGRPVTGLPARGTEPLLSGPGDLRSAHGARLLHGAILQVGTLCHETFNSDSAAEKHRVGRPGIDRRCLPPAEAGLVAVQQPWGTCWQAPGNDLRFGAAESAHAV